jgi:hypothetical protein
MSVQALSKEECLELLSQTSVGRIAATVAALPLVIPVHFRLDGESVVFGAEMDSVLAKAVHGNVVGFQADSFEPSEETGWSVFGVGVGSQLFNPQSEGPGSRSLAPWTLGERSDYVMRVDLTILQGSRIDRSEVLSLL